MGGKNRRTEKPLEKAFSNQTELLARITLWA